MLGAVFIIPAAVLLIYLGERMRPTTAFWVCAAIAACCLAGAKRPAVLIGAAALYVIGPSAMAAIVTRHAGSFVITCVCAVALAAAWRWETRPERRARHEFTVG